MPIHAESAHDPMMTMKLLLFALLAGATLEAAGAVRCVCSSPGECEPLTDDDCPQGASLVWDPCGCCRVCARLEFEPCGGPDGFHGTCAQGLECVADHADLLGTCRRPPASDKADCGRQAHEQHGCNVVETSCHCGSASVCPGDLPPFTFATHTECEINLKAMLNFVDGCDIPGHHLANGEAWSDEEKCRKCVCHHSQLDCESTKCTNCTSDKRRTEKCCQDCDPAAAALTKPIVVGEKEIPVVGVTFAGLFVLIPLLWFIIRCGAKLRTYSPVTLSDPDSLDPV
ncbi:cysteine-rich motor neuron 1 protein-like isoform X2 [Neocloeon triangulifer]|uniref:cysteine-rich motor neuron 1 protein-like isoform X2 n=1 Tax=Neocloeon triangulifer TaxID=2078957 RepID=UPI00286F3D80|nr:cysteine-rich motor neuron 1 protein-like isoform X2 [Neocloeon triangulifer]